ncbi:hypothetical protein [Pseudoalteromonas obscura]|uniref:Methyl-accepting chemotaxis protein n=1 Tax=Pseudoalteromonas obscura TaxID=3048491 RepID=A0ABT7ES76_9GAMM|nr:hypothetical protein [Pseudoalteromonas sp. P94(2023)]MDK2597909.1 hypothetical protein [Pseudoalteromonas sp. P94(2023)]
MGLISVVAKKQQQQVSTKQTAAEQQSTALKLLAKVLNCSEDDAIKTAEQFIENDCQLMVKNTDDSQQAEVVEQLETSLHQAASEAEDSAEAVTDAARSIEQSAVEIESATCDLKDTVEAIKK